MAKVINKSSVPSKSKIEKALVVYDILRTSETSRELLRRLAKAGYPFVARDTK